MELNQLAQFRAIAACGSVSRAAEELHVSQPALSAMLKKLEAELQVLLFDRVNNRIILNDAGRLALRHAETLLRCAEQMKSDLLEFAQRSKSFRVGFCDPGPMWFCTPKFSMLYPDVTLKTEVYGPQAQESALLESGRFDLLVTARPVEDASVTCAPFLREQQYLSVVRGDPAAGLKQVSLRDAPVRERILFLVDGAFSAQHLPLRREIAAKIRITQYTDYFLFHQAVRAGTTPTTTTRLVRHYRDDGDRVLIPITDALTERGFTGFVTESIAGLANKQLQTALDGFASIEPYKPEHVSEDKPEQTSIEKKPTVISVAGCCNRIGTTTQALQIIKYLQFLGHKAAYIQLNDSEYVQKAAGLYSAEDIDRSLGRVTLNGTDLYSKPDQIAEIRGMGYEYLVYDFGSFSSKSFNLIQFLEKDIRIIVGGDSPHELGAMQDVFRSPILQNSTYYIFSFVHENDFQEIRGLMEDKADMTFFAKYTPDPFVYTSDSNELYDKIIGATNTVEPQKRKECLLFSNTNRGTIRSGQICPLLIVQH